MNILKGIGSILAGMIFIIVTDTGTDFLLEKLGIFTTTPRFDTTWMVLTATIYRSIFNVGGGYLTAVLAPGSKMLYVVILGLIGTIMGIAGAIIMIPLNLGPAWYPIALGILAFPSVWVGGKLRTRTA